MKATLTLSEAAHAMMATYAGPDNSFATVSTDTRSAQPGELFFALRGERFDGADFVPDAVARGVAAVVVARESAPLLDAKRARLMLVDDARLALGRLGAYRRGHYDHPLLALTGSNGKTTVKEMAAAILAAQAGGTERVLATTGNLNNDIGVPLTLLRLAPAHRYAVIEMGMNHAGEIRYLSRLAIPDAAIVNNAGTAHLENLGSREAIAQAKGEIFEGLKASGTAVINADDPFATLWQRLAGSRRTFLFGIEHRADVRGRTLARGNSPVLELATPAGSGTIELQVPGEHNVRNALAAAAGALALGASLDSVLAGLSGYRGVKGRLQRKGARGGATLIDDTYNANPDSAKAAIEVLAGLPGTRILALGDMGELGPTGPALHAEVGTYAKAAGIDALYALGPLSIQAVQAFGANARHFSSCEEMASAIVPALGSQVTVLVKGSRYMQMERLVAVLAAENASAVKEGV